MALQHGSDGTTDLDWLRLEDAFPRGEDVLEKCDTRSHCAGLFACSGAAASSSSALGCAQTPFLLACEAAASRAVPDSDYDDSCDEEAQTKATASFSSTVTTTTGRGVSTLSSGGGRPGLGRGTHETKNGWGDAVGVRPDAPSHCG